MKALTVLLDEKNKYQDEKVFGGKSAFELCKEFFEEAEFLPASVENGGVEYLPGADISSGRDLLAKIYHLAREKNADFVIYSYADLPFVNQVLTARLTQTHIEYKCEYTFADGFPYGFAPELIDTGALGILLELSKTTQAAEGDKPLCRESLYNLIKTDINSFEVEAELSDTDWRLFRFKFCCQNKDSFLQGRALYQALGEERGKCEKLSKFDVEKVSEIASKKCGLLKTVPGFYNIQICGERDTKALYEADSISDAGGLLRTGEMSLENFSLLCKKIADFSEKAVLNLGWLCEPLRHPQLLSFIEEALKYDGLSVFFETSGLNLTSDFCQGLKNAVEKAAERTNSWQKLMIAVKLDAVSGETYSKVNGSQADNFNKALAACDQLCKALPAMIYPQFTRMNENEAELEAFFRYWNEKANPSGGNCIIQKYNDFSGLLPACKPADLSPVERNICWHLRRDMCILLDGSVVTCPNLLFSKENEVLGSAFDEDLNEIWKKTDSKIMDQLGQKYCECCGKCDEYYTFNF